MTKWVRPIMYIMMDGTAGMFLTYFQAQKVLLFHFKNESKQKKSNLSAAIFKDP